MDNGITYTILNETQLIKACYFKLSKICLPEELKANSEAAMICPSSQTEETEALTSIRGSLQFLPQKGLLDFAFPS